MSAFYETFSASVKIFVKKISRQDLLTHSAALSFYCALSLAPLIVLLLSSIAFLGPESKTEFIHQVRLVIGLQASEAITLIIEGTKKNQNLRSLSEIISFIILLISASSVFAQLKSTIGMIFFVDPDTPEESISTMQEVMIWMRQRLFSVGMMISFIFISVLSLIFSVFLSLTLPEGEGEIFQLLNQTVTVIVYTGIFFLVFYYVPHKKVKKKDALIGGGIASVMFITGKYLLSRYLGEAAVASAYGATGSLMALLIWVYYSSFIVFASAVITSILPKTRELYRGFNEKK